MRAVLNQLVLALMSHLPSRSEEHRHLAQTALGETLKRVDSAALSPAFAAATRKANVKQKPFMLATFSRELSTRGRVASDLNEQLFPSKPKQVEVSALPVLWELLRPSGVSQASGDAEVGRLSNHGCRCVVQWLTTPEASPAFSARVLSLTWRLRNWTPRGETPSST